MMLERIQNIQKGYSEARYNNKKYGVVKTEFNNGNSYKIYAKELGGNDFISLNYYITSNNELLKPCEMPVEKVMHFLQNFTINK